MGVELYCGDCLEVMKSLPDGSVDAVVADPPFSIPVKYQDANGDFPRSWGDLAVMEPWALLWLTEVRRITKDTGQVYICCDGNSYPVFFKAALPLWPRSHLLVWYKPTGRRGAGWKHSHELILHLATKQSVYLDGFRQDVIGIMPVRTLNRQHPAQKPGDLIEWLLEAIPENATVLDPFMGSGTTGVACVRTGRNFVGIESEPPSYEIAQRRIAEAQAQPALLEVAP
jgi:site-specific DNA-methyltransferase (adenine-specific)